MLGLPSRYFSENNPYNALFVLCSVLLPVVFYKYLPELASHETVLTVLYLVLHTYPQAFRGVQVDMHKNDLRRCNSFNASKERSGGCIFRPKAPKFLQYPLYIFERFVAVEAHSSLCNFQAQEKGKIQSN